MPQDATRSRADMEKIIAEGGSIMLADGRIVTRVDALPTEAALAAGDHDRLEAERARLQAAVDADQKQLDAVEKQIAALPKPAAEDKPHAPAHHAKAPPK